MIRVGPAGWSYADWEGRVYPHHKNKDFHPLAFLTRFVDCLEINSTFYRPPAPEHAARWARIATSHPDFRLTAKLFQGFTHDERVEASPERERSVAVFLDGIAPLVRSHRLSALLVQFPVSFRHGPESVRRLGLIKAWFGHLPLVLEVRDASWFEPPGLRAIDGLGYSLAHIDLPAAWNHPPDWHAPIGPLGYLRLHGRNRTAWFQRGAGRDAKYDYLYGEAELDELTAKARRLAGERDETYVITNNHFSGKAVANALEIKARIEDAAVPAPVELVRAFPRLARRTRPEGQRELF